MNGLNRVIGIGLILCIGLVPVNDVAVLAADMSLGPDHVRQQVGQLGVGACLKVRLVDGRNVKGSVVAVGQDGFELQGSPGESPR